ncbi:MAG: DUF1844 domain-containing protein [Phycisphaerales bacterium]
MTETNPTNPASPSLHVDADWKAQAQAERERLAREESARSARDAEMGPDGLPPAEFRSLVGLLASQAVMGLGTMADQQGRVVVDLPGSQFAIDLLQVLADKTKGNLTPDEEKELTEVLRELQHRFAQITRMVAEQMQRSPGSVQAAAAPPAGATLGGVGAPGAAPAAKPSSSKLIVP